MPEIFIVDENLSQVEIVPRRLYSLGYQLRMFGSAEEFLDADPIHPEDPGCLVVNTRLPRISGIALFERIVRQSPQFPVILLSSQPETSLVVQTIKQGAFDFLREPVDLEFLLERMREAVDSHAFILNRKLSDQEFCLALEALTMRERQILQLMLRAMNTKEISRQMEICIKSVSRHRMHLLEKLQCKNEMDLVIKMLRHNLISIEFEELRLQFPRSLKSIA